MNQLGKAILLFLSSDDQDRNSRTMVFLLNARPTVVDRVVEQKEPLRSVAAAYEVSHETIRRLLLRVLRLRGQQEY
jgi:hypothetical protein